MDGDLPQNVIETFTDRYKIFLLPTADTIVRLIVPVLPDLKVKFAEPDSNESNIFKKIATTPSFKFINIMIHREEKDFRVFAIPFESGYFCHKIENARKNRNIIKKIDTSAAANIPAVNIPTGPDGLPVKFLSVLCPSTKTTISIRMPREVIPVAMIAAFSPQIKCSRRGNIPASLKTGKCGLPNCSHHNHGYLGLPYFPSSE